MPLICPNLFLCPDPVLEVTLAPLGKKTKPPLVSQKSIQSEIYGLWLYLGSQMFRKMLKLWKGFVSDVWNVCQLRQFGQMANL